LVPRNAASAPRASFVSGTLGTFAAVLSSAGIALLAWSGFHFKLFDAVIAGRVRAGIGMVIAIVAAKKEYAL
jgi:hypothetical protein